MADIANSGNLANVLTGETHVFYGALGLLAVGVSLSYLGWKHRDRFILALGLIVTVGAAGIAVDVWAHSYNH